MTDIVDSGAKWLRGSAHNQHISANSASQDLIFDVSGCRTVTIQIAPRAAGQLATFSFAIAGSLDGTNWFALPSNPSAIAGVGLFTFDCVVSKIRLRGTHTGHDSDIYIYGIR